MSEEEQLSHIMAIRSSRRIKKVTTKSRSTPKKAQPKSKMDLLNMLSPEQAGKLLEELNG